LHSNVDPNDEYPDYQITSPKEANQKNINVATVADIDVGNSLKFRQILELC